MKVYAIVVGAFVILASIVVVWVGIDYYIAPEIQAARAQAKQAKQIEASKPHGWGAIKTGMTQDQVKDILGDPDKKYEYQDNTSLWVYYITDYGHDITFDTDSTVSSKTIDSYRRAN
jgi:outer membrane protein assembly factor BamE (lipoprotein component of BamABCDE complex)